MVRKVWVRGSPVHCRLACRCWPCVSWGLLGYETVVSFMRPWPRNDGVPAQHALFAPAWIIQRALGSVHLSLVLPAPGWVEYANRQIAMAAPPLTGLEGDTDARR